MISAIWWKNNRVYMIDQRALPAKEIIIEHATYREVAKSIENMVIRGAPAIGIAAAMGVALGVLAIDDSHSGFGIEKKFKTIKNTLMETRPTAVNLSWALKKMTLIFNRNRKDIPKLKKEVVKEALEMRNRDIEINRSIGESGKKLFGKGEGILTHCNTGGLATAGYGTALGVVKSVYEKYKDISVVITETRPFLQGARLTAWELKKEKIPFRMITDGTAGFFMKKGIISAVVVGADRIARNGDTANKIGTYSLAVLAKYNGIPFYIAAPLSTVDLNTKKGDDIPIEERDKNEVLHCGGVKITPEGTSVYNPAFDITPVELISGFITERGVVSRDFEEKFKELKTQ